MNKYQSAYVDFLKKFVKPQRYLKIIFDCSNGTAGSIIKELFKTYKLINLKLINYLPDGNFPGHGPNPLVKGAMGQLKKSVLKNKADLGVIFDADGDRTFFIDDKGRFVDPDVIVRLLAWHLKPKKLIYDVRTGWLIRKFKIENLKLKISESRVGHYFIKKLMRKIGADFAVERSGHYYFKKFFNADSGILAAIEVINAVSKLPYKFSDFIDLLPQYYRSGEINYKIKTESYKLLKSIENKYKKYAVKISHIDGLFMEFSPKGKGGFWFNLRPSNTEPLIRLNIEAENKRTLEMVKKELTKQTR